ncbi:FUSC family protein [Mycobacterium sp. ITM-2016-00317]|uniref:FUSC family protein n=1 Tax=Mycobacterium sp. ITM-2016-00317 TaxID=2099694 RepID=UPI00287F6FB7|nr:FUSC family protein [Mycobacterium sp. ITM-2016-00317]WNG85310.1 FUSC family protein [Mycobacterium sp. ITM-2016-00317]
MRASSLSRRFSHGYAALTHAATPRGWRGVLRIDAHRAGLAVPLRVGAAVMFVFVVGGLTGQRDVAGFAALGALIAAFCRPDPYPVRAGRLAVLGSGITASIGLGAALGVSGGGVLVETAVISVLAGVAAYLMWALHIVGPGAVVFVFGAAGAQAFAHDGGDVLRAVTSTATGAVIGVVAALAPWLFRTLRRSAVESTAPQRESLWATLTRAPHRTLVSRSLRITVAGAVAAGIAMGLGFEHRMWATMGAVATMQGVGYHLTVHRGVQRLLGNVGGAALAAALLALPLGYWGAVAAIVVFQTAAEIASTVNYALTSLAVTPMALLLTGLQAGLAPAVAVDRVLDTAVGIVTGIVIAAVTISGADAGRLRAGPTG